ncbi:WD40 repeat domain-containing protein [Deinococcus sp. UYEF24]
MAQWQAFNKKRLRIAGLSVLAVIWLWFNADAALNRILYRGDRYPATDSLFGPVRFESIDVASSSRDSLAVATGSVTSPSLEHFTASVSVTDRSTGKRRWRTGLNTPEHHRSVHAVLWSPDDQQVVSNDTDGNVTVLDAGSGKILKQLKVNTYSPCVFSFVTGGLLLTERDIPKGQTFLALRSWPALTPVWRVPLNCRDAAIGNLDASGTLVAIPLEDGLSVGMFDLRTHAFRGPVLRVADSQTTLESLSVRPDGQQVAGGLGNGTVVVWDVPSGKVKQQFHAHGGLVGALSWSASGEALASSAFGKCDWWRSECVVVTQFGGASPDSHVVWNDRYHATSSIEWLKRSELLLSDNTGVVTVASGLPDP